MTDQPHEPAATTEIEVEVLHQMIAELDRQRTELREANLRTDVALVVTPLIDNVVEDHTGRDFVVADIVTCWLNLDPTVRQKYERASNAAASGLGHFAADYATCVSDSWRPTETLKRVSLTDKQAAEMDNLQWVVHVAEVQQRRILGTPPPSDWLTQFPLLEAHK